MHLILDTNDIYLEAHDIKDTIRNLIEEKCDVPYKSINLFLNRTMTDMLEYELIGQLTKATSVHGTSTDLYNLNLFESNKYENITLEEIIDKIAHFLM